MRASRKSAAPRATRARPVSRTTVVLDDKAALGRRVAKELGASLSEVCRQGIVLLAERHGLLAEPGRPAWADYSYEGAADRRPHKERFAEYVAKKHGRRP